MSMETPNPGQTTPVPTPVPSQALVWQHRLWRAVWPLMLVGVFSYLLYRASPAILMLGGAAALGWLQWGIAKAVLPNARPYWLPQVLVAAMLLVFLMQLVYGWREEMGYWANLWHVFGWKFVASLFWTFVLAWGVRVLLKTPF